MVNASYVAAMKFCTDAIAVLAAFNAMATATSTTVVGVAWAVPLSNTLTGLTAAV